MNVAQALAKLLADLGVKGSEGFVKQQHPGFDGKCTREGDALALTAGELAWIAGANVWQLDQVEQFGHAARNLRAWRT
jgi:hypothetical protein